MKQPQRRGAVGGVQAVLLAGHVIVNVVASAFFAAVEPVSLSHNCIHSDEVTTVDLGSGREQVGVTQGRPELNPAGTSAGTRLWKLTKPYSSNWLGLEARVGIERGFVKSTTPELSPHHQRRVTHNYRTAIQSGIETRLSSTQDNSEKKQQLLAKRTEEHFTLALSLALFPHLKEARVGLGHSPTNRMIWR